MSFWRTQTVTRLMALSLVGALVTSALPAPVSGADPSPALVAGLVTVDPAPWTTTSDVTLRLLPPSDDSGRVRLSNDGVAWIERPWAASITWSLIDPAAGGHDADGEKSVFVEYGDGITWRWSGLGTTTLDRVRPSMGEASVTIDGRTWRGHLSTAPSEAVAASRHSLDGAVWSAWQPSWTSVDLFDSAGVGPWVDGDRSIWIQVRDLAGNVSDPVSADAHIDSPVFSGLGSEGPLSVTFETPNLPIEGSPFVIRPIYPDGYVLPADAWCEWVLHWGDDDSIMGAPNEAWGEIVVERSKSRGVCDGWTFTVPHTDGRQFHWMFQVMRKDPGQGWGNSREGLFVSATGAGQIFRAAGGSTDRRFLASSFPFAYLLPETTISQKGDPVTYRLHVVGTTTVPQTGTFWTYPTKCYLNPHWGQKGGTTYTYTPNCDGPWVTGWTGTMLGGYMRSQYDPLVDGRAPKVVAPKVKLRAATFGTSAPTTVSWSATDKGSGVHTYQLQVSRNGGAWSSITLPSRLTTSVTRSLSTTGTYRFRVRARDRVGNWSAWVAGPTISARAVQDSSTSVTYSTGWKKVTSDAFSGGSARTSRTAGAKARISTSARSIAWVARRGPDGGLAQIRVDGQLVATVDLYAPTLGTRGVVFARNWSSRATHTVEIRVLGTAGRPSVVLDAFLVIR
jgi:hypothetical protein